MNRSYSKKRHINESNLKLDERFINERASDIRNYAINDLGWKEKNDELSSGGDITSELSTIINELVYSAHTYVPGPGCKGTFTSGNDKFHKNRKSRHNQGMAVDVTMESSCHGKFIDLLNVFKTKYPGFSFIDEYKNPSKGSTGGHFHISYTKGSPEVNSSGDFDVSGSTSSSSSSTPSGSESEIGKQFLSNVFFGGKR